MVQKILGGVACLLLTSVAGAAVSESDYLADVPTVISVSRLSQTLDDTPGAVTILDRDFIRMTGARSVVDVLRFVPGFQTTSAFETDAPMATYHGRNDDWANRIQVLVDGRSVYSGLLQGSAGIGWQALAIDDIERIEVLRGSNSASYGARAFLGVVNIISRDVRETVGQSVSVARGENNIADVGASIGWSAWDASFRLSADSVSDDGLRGAFGKNHTERMNFSSHFTLEKGAELDLRAGGVGIYAGRGEVGNIEGNPARNWFQGSQYLQADWHRPLSDSQDLSIGASHTENRNIDHFLYMTPGTYYLAPVSFDGVEYVDVLTFQHTLRLSPTLRTVWGGEFRREKVEAPELFYSLGSVTSDFYRLFGSAEWRFQENLLLNVGALAEHSEADGDTVSPRIMLNWHVAPGHTLRAGVSTAFRPPSSFEKYGQVQYYDVNGQNPTGFYTYNNGTLKPEKLFARELGYYYAPLGSTVNGDLRIFQEEVTDGISHTDGPNPQTNLNNTRDTANGAELQLNWLPDPATRVMLAQAWTQIDVYQSTSAESQFRITYGAPRYSASLVAMHSFDGGWQASVMFQQTEDVALMSTSSATHPSPLSLQRTDLRLAKDMVVAGHKAQLAFVVQNLGNPVQDGDRKFYFYQQAFVSLKIEN